MISLFFTVRLWPYPATNCGGYRVTMNPFNSLFVTNKALSFVIFQELSTNGLHLKITLLQPSSFMKNLNKAPSFSP